MNRITAELGVAVYRHPNLPDNFIFFQVEVTTIKDDEGNENIAAVIKGFPLDTHGQPLVEYISLDDNAGTFLTVLHKNATTACPLILFTTKRMKSVFREAPMPA